MCLRQDGCVLGMDRYAFSEMDGCVLGKMGVFWRWMGVLDKMGVFWGWVEVLLEVDGCV